MLMMIIQVVFLFIIIERLPRLGGKRPYDYYLMLHQIIKMNKETQL